MNLLFVTTHLPPDNHFGGVVQSGQALLTSLRNHLPGITACCVSPDPGRITVNNPLRPVRTKTLMLHRWGFSPAFEKNLAPLVSRADIVAINGITTYPVTITGRTCIKLRKPYIVSLRGGLLPGAMALKAIRKQLYYNLFTRSILSNASAVHVTSNAERKCAEALGIKSRITVIPNGAMLPPDDQIDSTHLPPKIQSLLPEQKLVLFLGRIEPIKGLDILLKSWADVMNLYDRDHAMLVLAGPDYRGYAWKLKRLIRKLNITDRVIFTGILDDKAKWAAYQRADIFVLPSYSENFGLTVTEALACGTPVIATTGTPWKELEEIDAGRCVPPDTKALTEAICELLSASIGQRQAMGQRGRAHIIKKYSWDVTARKYKTLCENILDNKNIPMYPEPSGA